MKLIKYVAVALIAVGCSSVILQPSDFSWPVENVLTVDTNGFITEDRHSFTINVKPLFQEEFEDSTAAIGKELRIIRDQAGCYYITGPGFKNVYKFQLVEGGLKLEDEILISDSLALTFPAFNQHAPNIELLDGAKKYLLNNNGIERMK